MGQYNVANPCRSGLATQAIQLDSKDFSQPVAVDTGRVLQGDETFIHQNRGGMLVFNRRDVIQRFAGLLKHHIKVFRRQFSSHGRHILTHGSAPS